MLCRNLISLLLVAAMTLPSVALAQTQNLELQDLALPTDVKDLGKSPGAVYYSTTNKNKALMPVHFWGEVGKPGLHFIPVDSKLIKGLSFAGGGSSTARLDEVIVNRLEGDKVKRYEFDLEAGGDVSAHEYVLMPNDTVFIEKDRSIENRAYYTSLVGVIATIISSILIIKRIEESNR